MLREKDRKKATYFVSVGNPCRKYRSWQISQTSLFLSGRWKVVTLSAKIKRFNDNSLLLTLLCVDSASVTHAWSGIWKLMLPLQLGERRWNGVLHTWTCVSPTSLWAPHLIMWYIFAGSTEASAGVISLIQHMVILLETSFSSVSMPTQVFWISRFRRPLDEWQLVHFHFS